MECAKNIKDLAEMTAEHNKLKEEKEKLERKKKIEKDTIQLCETVINLKLIENAKQGISGCKFHFAFHYNGRTIGIKKRNTLYRTPNIYEIDGEYDLDILEKYLKDNCYDTHYKCCGTFKTYTGKYSGDKEYVMTIVPHPSCE